MESFRLRSSTEESKPSPGPPPLPYDLREHKTSIAIQWSLTVFVACILQIVLYYVLRFKTDLPRHAVFEIPQAILGIFGVEGMVVRLWQLLRKNTTATPLGSSPRYLDYFQFAFIGGFVISDAELIIGALPRRPLTRLMAMPAPSLLFYVGAQLLLVTLLHMGGYRTPVRLSSTARGSVFRPAVYILMEDIVAVDGGGGFAYRKALNARFEASPVFRQLLVHLSLFWGVGAVVVATVVTVVVFTVDEEVAYGIGWGVPFVWAGVWTVITFKWARRSLSREQSQWCRPLTADSVNSVTELLE